MRKRAKILLSGFLVVLIALYAVILLTGTTAEAGPVITGNPKGAVSRAIIADGTTVKEIVYFPAGVKTMVGANTPVASDPVCGLNGQLHAAEVVLVGTMAGTAPTLAVKWQNSIDGGANWNDVGTWTTINATVTPAAQRQVVSDVWNATTAVAFGDCWRATYVFGGTGTVTANISVKGLEK